MKTVRAWDTSNERWRRLGTLYAYVYDQGVPCVLQFGRYSVYIQSEGTDRHHLPHCHVRWKGGSASVSLATFTVLAGTLPQAVLDEVRQHRMAIIAEWNRLNPYRPAQEDR